MVLVVLLVVAMGAMTGHNMELYLSLLAFGHGGVMGHLSGLLKILELN